MSGENGRDKSEWWHFQFEPAAWLEDSGVQSLTFHDRGIWFELLLRMHKSPRRGALLFDTGAAMDDDAIASILRLPLPDWMATRGKLVSRGIAGVDAATGALFNRKMLRDTEKRAQESEFRREAGRKGAEKRWHGDSTPIARPRQTMGNNNNNQNKSNPSSSPTLDGFDAEKTPDPETPELQLSQDDPLKSVNFRVGVLLLLSVKIADRVARGIANEHPIGRIAEVVIAAQGSKKPSGFAIKALEKGYVVPPLEADERERLLDTIAKLPKDRSIPRSTARAPLIERQPGETDDDYLKRYNEAIKKKREEGGPKGPTKV